MKINKLLILLPVMLLGLLNITVQANVIGNLSGDVAVSHGSLSYSLNIATPDSIHGLNPDMSVIYQQNAGASILGSGFLLNASSIISRCTPNMEKDNFSSGIELSSNARFCHNGSKLVAIDGENGASGTEYRAYVDENSRYLSQGGSNNTPDTWQQFTPHGYIYSYQRIGSTNDLFATWFLVKTENQFGSSITYHYSNDAVPNLERIEYPGYQVNFDYVDKSQSLIQYQQGTQLASNKLLDKIKIFSGLDQLYEYRFAYDAIGNSYQTERLSSVLKCHGQAGVDGCLKPLEFGYMQQPNGSPLDAYDNKTIVIPRSEYATDSAQPEVGFAYRPSFVAGELNGDGVTDFCYYKPGTGLRCTLYDSSGYGAVSTWSENLGYAANIDDFKFYANVTLVDLNKDGLSDYCLSDATGVRCGINNGNEGFSSATYWSRSDTGGFSHENYPRLINVDGDGLADVCGLKAETYSCLKNTGAGFSGEIRRIAETLDIEYIFDDVLQDPVEGSLMQPDWVDIDGDLDLDICWLELSGQYKCSLRSTNVDTQQAEYSLPTVMPTPGGVLVELPPPPISFDPDTATGSQFAAYQEVLDIYNDAISDLKLSWRRADLNGDGLPDICYEKNKVYQCHINEGDGFSAASPWLDMTTLNGIDSNKNAFLVSISLSDLDFDGLSDFCAIYDNYQHCAYNQSGSFGELTRRQVINDDIDTDFSETSVYANLVRKLFGSRTRFRLAASSLSYGKFVPVADVNADGYSDTCYRSIDGVVCVTNDTFAPQALLTRITDSFGQVTEVSYENLLGAGLYASVATVPTGFRHAPPNRRVVASLSTDSGVRDINTGSSVRNTIDYKYYDYFVNPDDDISGFSAIEWNNADRGIRTRSTYYLEKHLLGHEKIIDEFIGVQLVKKKTNNYDTQVQANGTIRKILDSTVEVQNDLDGNLISTTTITNANLDSYNYPQTVTQEKVQGSETLTTVTSTTYLHDTTNWLLGRPDYHTVQHSDQAGRSVTREVDYEYLDGLLDKEIIQPGSLDQKTIKYGYDTFGNADSVTTSGSGLTRSVNKTHDDQGRVRTITNALNQIETFTYHARCGGVETHTDIAGKTTTKRYDDLCREYKVEAPDANSTTKEFFWADDVADNNWVNMALGYPYNYYNPIIYKVKETSAIGPWKMNYYDAQGRVVRSESTGYSDSANQRIIHKHDVRDRYGRKTATTLPYYETNGLPETPSWITITHDDAGRPLTESKAGPQADGSISVSTYDYQGNTTTLTYSNYSKASTTGIHGKAKTVTENGRTIDYDYDPIGNLLTTTTGNLVTVVEYDDRGNKEKQTDPSMGIWEYDYNAFGELVWQKDAKGQETTIQYDGLGRQESRTDDDGVTSWTYYPSGNGIGQKHTETGTHASRLWNYNALGLVSSEELTIDNQTFITSFDYDAFSRVVLKTEHNGQRINYKYDNTGAMSTVSIPKEDFNDFDFAVLESEYRAMLVQIVNIEAQIAQAEAKASYHQQRALEYQAKVHEFMSLLGEVNEQIDTIQQAVQEHLDMAERYLEQARIAREQAEAWHQTYGERKFIFIEEKDGFYKFQHKACTKKKRSLLGRKCVRWDIFNIKIPAYELNDVDTDSSDPELQDRSIMHGKGTHYYSAGYVWEGGDSGDWRYQVVDYHEAKPYQIYEQTAAAWEELRLKETTNAANVMVAQNANGNTTRDVWKPVEVTREVWVPIAGDITFFIKTNATFSEYQWVTMSVDAAAAYYSQQAQHYRDLAAQELAAYQSYIEGTGEFENLAGLQSELSSLFQSQGFLEENLVALGVDVSDLEEAAITQASVQAVDGQLNIWMATMRSADGRLQDEIYGNGLRTQRGINTQTGLVDRIVTSSFTDTVLRDITYRYNARGLVDLKQDLVTGRHQTSETFGYNLQGQLEGWTYSQTVQDESGVATDTLSRTYGYDNRGNMTDKTGAGTMIYSPVNNRLDSRLLDSGESYSYSYDDNGNLTQGDGRSYTWNAFNKVRQIDMGGSPVVNFEYDASRSRVIKHTANETVYYINSGYEIVLRKTSTGATFETVHRHNIMNGHDVVATYEKTDRTTNVTIENALQSDKIAYYHRDIIGSGEVVTGSDMEVIARRFYTPYGEDIEQLILDQQPVSANMLDPQMAVTADESVENEVQLDDIVDYKQLMSQAINPHQDFTILSETLRGNPGFSGDLRGYTSHEEIPEVGLINMNARLYDPVIGRFISADSIIPDMTRPLAYNRYSYVEGNPVTTRDPTGHWGWALAFFVAAHDTDNQALQIASTIWLSVSLGDPTSTSGSYGTYFNAINGEFWNVAATAASTSATVTLLQTGELRTADITNAMWAGISAGVANHVGYGDHGVNYDTDYGWLKRAAFHGATQGTISTLRGDGFAQGAVAGFTSSMTGDWVKGKGNVELRSIAAIGVSYLAAEATGGNGSTAAIQALMVHLYNHEADFDAAEELVNKVFKNSGRSEVYFQTDSGELGPFESGAYFWNEDKVLINIFDVGNENYGQNLFDTDLTDQQARQLLNTYFHEGIHKNASFASKFAVQYLESDSIYSPGRAAHEAVYNAADILTNRYYDEYNRLRKSK